MKNEVWIVGRNIWRESLDGHWDWTWDFHGVFGCRKNAEALCRDQNWFIVPIVVDQPFSEEPNVFAGLVKPNNSKAKPLRWSSADQKKSTEGDLDACSSD